MHPLWKEPKEPHTVDLSFTITEEHFHSLETTGPSNQAKCARKSPSEDLNLIPEVQYDLLQLIIFFLKTDKAWMFFCLKISKACHTFFCVRKVLLNHKHWLVNINIYLHWSVWWETYSFFLNISHLLPCVVCWCHFWTLETPGKVQMFCAGRGTPVSIYSQHPHSHSPHQIVSHCQNITSTLMVTSLSSFYISQFSQIQNK